MLGGKCLNFPHIIWSLETIVLVLISTDDGLFSGIILCVDAEKLTKTSGLLKSVSHPIPDASLSRRNLGEKSVTRDSRGPVTRLLNITDKPESKVQVPESAKSKFNSEGISLSIMT